MLHPRPVLPWQPHFRSDRSSSRHCCWDLNPSARLQMVSSAGTSLVTDELQHSHPGACSSGLPLWRNGAPSAQVRLPGPDHSHEPRRQPSPEPTDPELSLQTRPEAPCHLLLQKRCRGLSCGPTHLPPLSPSCPPASGRSEGVSSTEHPSCTLVTGLQEPRGAPGAGGGVQP